MRAVTWNTFADKSALLRRDNKIRNLKQQVGLGAYMTACLGPSEIVFSKLNLECLEWVHIQADTVWQEDYRKYYRR